MLAHHPDRSGCAVALPSAECRQELSQHGPGVRGDADGHGIVAAELVDIDVDVDELRRRDVERCARHPTRRDPVVEPDADGEQHIAVFAASFPGSVPFRPTPPSTSSWRASIAPSPLGAKTTGIPSRSASSAEVLAALGHRDAVAGQQQRALAAAEQVDDPLDVLRAGRDTPRDPGVPGAGSGISTSASSTNTLNGTSTFTGPGLPLVMVLNAWRSADGSMSDPRRVEHPLGEWTQGLRTLRLEVPVEFLEGSLD